MAVVLLKLGLVAASRDRPLRIGIRFESHWPAERLQPFARTAERLGFDQLWVTEDCFFDGGLATAAVALASTERIGVGIGLLPVATRNPATLAMELASLARAFPGRLIPAFGRGVFDWMDQVGELEASSFGNLEETVRVLRAILTGGVVNAAVGRVTLRDVQLAHPPDVALPLLIGSTGPRGLRVAHRVADGIVLPEVSSPKAVEWARREAGEAKRTVVTAMLSIGDDGPAAVAATRPVVEHMAATGLFPQLTSRAGLGTDGRGVLTEEQLRLMTVAGTPDDCLASIERWAEAGVDDLVLLARDPDAGEQAALFAHHVLPRFESS